MFRIELEQLNDMILEYESQLEMLDQQYLEMVKTSWRLRESWEGVSKEQFAVNSDDVCARLVFFTNRMKKMKNILKKTAQPEVNRELNRCEGFADTLCMYGPSEPGESHEPVGTLYLDDSYIAGIAEKSAGIGYEYTPREQSFWNNAMDCIDGGWFGRGGLKFVSLNMSGRDQEFRRYSKEQGDFILQFNESFFHYQQNIDSLEDRLSAEFGTIMEIQTADITGRIYEPLITADRSVNLDRLGYLMTLEPGALSDADYQDLIRAYELVSVDKQAKEVKDFINRVYLPHFKKMGGGKYQVSYTVSPVAKELSKRYREYINGLGEVNLTTQAVRELRAEMLEAGCSELSEITGGIVEDNRPKGIFGEAKRDIQEMWKNLDEKIMKALEGKFGSNLAYVHEKLVFGYAGSSPVVQELSMRGKDEEELKQKKENWHELNHELVIGEYQWISEFVSGVAGLPDTAEMLWIAINEKGGAAVIGDLFSGIVSSLGKTYKDITEGDIKTRGRAIGKLIPDLVLAVVGAVKAAGGLKTAVASKKMATEARNVEALDNLSDAGRTAALGEVVEGALVDEIADKIDDVVGSAVKGGRGTVPRNINGQRTSRYKTLTPEEIESLRADLEALGADPSIFRFNEGYQTGFSDQSGLIYVRGDVLPDLSSTHPRDLMSQRAVLAHEYYGHKYFGDLFGEKNPLPGAWNDEFRASYNAALNAPNLTEMDRMYLMADALERAKEAGVNIKITDNIRRVLYGY